MSATTTPRLPASVGNAHGVGAPKRILMLAYTTYPYDGRVRLEAETLVKWGYEVIFLALKEGPVARTYTLDGVTVRELNVRKYRGDKRLNYALSYLAFMVHASLASLWQFFKLRTRLMHVHNMPNTIVLATALPRLLGCKVVLDLHDTVPETYEAKFGRSSGLIMMALRLEERLCCALADELICVNHVQRNAVIERGIAGEKISTVITIPTFRPNLRPRYRDRDAFEAFRVVNHGTVAKRLGNDLLIKAAPALRLRIPGFELHIIGGGKDVDELKDMARELGVSAFVVFHEKVPWDELVTKLSTMDVGIVANRLNIATQLMLPSKLIDFAALSIPAVVPRLKTIQYYFAEDMVSYFEPESVDSLIEALVNLYRDSDRRQRQAQNARQFLEKYDWETQTDGLKRLYERIASEAAST